MTEGSNQKCRYHELFRGKYAEDFQTWFETLAKALHGIGDFQSIRKTSGDGGLDGFAINSAHVYQIYAPSRITELKDRETARKIWHDFRKALSTLGSFKKWSFLHNHPEGKIGKQTVAAIRGLREKYPAIEIRILDVNSLWKLLEKLEPAVLRRLFPVEQDAVTPLARYQTELNRHADFYPRPRLFAQMRAYCKQLSLQKRGGYWLLIADPWFGKSAFSARILSKEPGAVGHFFKRSEPGWRDVSFGFQSIVEQLTDRYSDLQIDRTWPLTVRFTEALSQVSLLLKANQQQMVVLDGVDEAENSPGQPIWLDYLPPALPPRIVVVITGRAGDYGWLPTSSQSAKAILQPVGRASREEILDMLRDKSRTLLEPAFEENILIRIADACENHFGLACWLLDPKRSDFENDLKDWKTSPEKIAVGPVAWIKNQWRRLIDQAHLVGIPTNIVEAIIGFLAVAKDPLSEEQVNALLDSARRESEDDRSLQCFAFNDLRGNRVREVLRLASGLFEPPEVREAEHRVPCRFFHASFPQTIVSPIEGLLTSQQLSDLRQLLANSCERAWSDSTHPARRFAATRIIPVLAEAIRPEKIYAYCRNKRFLMEQRDVS